MSTLESKSPAGTVAIKLIYEGEIRFGPPYFSCIPVNFSADFSELTVGQHIDWKADSSSCVMLVFHSLRSDQKPDTELMRVEVNSGIITSIERNPQGMIHMRGFDQDDNYTYEVVLPTRRITKTVSW